MIEQFARALARGLGLRSEAKRMTIEEYGRLFLSARDDLLGDAIFSNTRAYKDSWAVRRAVTLKSGDMSALPFAIWKGTDKVDGKHPLTDLLSNPNPMLGYDAQGILRTSYAIKELYGEVFWLKDWGQVESPDGRRSAKVKALWPFKPTDVREIVKDGELVAWEFRFDRSRYTVDPLDVVHFADFDPSRHRAMLPSRGSSWLEGVVVSASSDSAASRFTLSFFEKGAVPNGVYWTEQDMSQQTADDLLARIKSKLLGGNQPLVLHSGLKYIDTRVSQKDAEYVAGKQLWRDEIFLAAGVPLSVAGIQGANFATSREDSRTYWGSTLKPLITAFASTITQSFLTESERARGLSFAFDLEGVEALKRDRSEQVKQATLIWRMGVPYNEIEKMLDLGTGPVPGGDQGWIPAGMVPADSQAASVMTGEGQPSNATGEPPEPENPPQGDTDDPAPDADKPGNTGRLSPERGKLDRMAAAILEDRDAPDDFDPVLDEIERIIRGDDQKLRDLVRAFYRQAFTIGVDQVASDLGGLLSGFDVENVAAKSFIDTKAIQIVGINETTVKKVRDVIGQALAEGKTSEEIADALRQVYRDFEGPRAKTIALTEMAQTVNGARYLAMEEEEVEQHEWLDANDERVRDTHQREDGHVVKVGEPFPVTGLLYPGDVNGAASETVNCRCVAAAAEPERSREDRASYVRSVINGYKKTEGRFAKALKRYWFEQSAAILKHLAEMETEA